jgi:hypothetical protein
MVDFNDLAVIQKNLGAHNFRAWFGRLMSLFLNSGPQKRLPYHMWCLHVGLLHRVYLPLSDG